MIPSVLTGLTALLGVIAATAVPLVDESARLSVTIKNGTVVGRSRDHIDSFNGIPFAAPPTDLARACPQQNTTAINTTGVPDQVEQALAFAFKPPSSQGEDCLTLDIARPANVAPNAKLPVLFWIFGGGWEVGSTQSNNGSLLVSQSVALGKPIIYVAVNYRLSAFGLLPGKELQAEGSTNLAVKDQRMALQWVAENIAAFGGDPDQVSIWGESVGGLSVYHQMIANGGDNRYKGKPLFRGAILNSGGVARVDPVDAPQAQKVFDQVVAAAGCEGSKEVLACLRAVPYDVFLNASNSNPDFFSYSDFALSYPVRNDPRDPFFNLTPIAALQKGAYAKVPLIASSLEDDGTLFALAPRNISTTANLIDYLKTWWPSTKRSLIADLVKTYPDDQASGAPFGTGNANSQLYPQYKRLAAIAGDYQFVLPRRLELATMARTQRAWSFIGSYLHGFPLIGTFHTSDVREVHTQTPDVQAGKTLQSAYINFVNDLDPNGPGVGAAWPQWTVDSKQVLNVSASGVSTLRDDFRQASYELYASHPNDFYI